MNRAALIFPALMLLLFSCGKKTAETRPLRKDVTETVFASGVLEANNLYLLTAQSDGYLIDIAFKENDMVKAGQVLAVIDNKQNQLNTQNTDALYAIAQSNTAPDAPMLMQAKNQLVNSRQKLEFDSLQAIRYKKLLEANSIARAEYESVALQFQTSRANYLNALENYRQKKQQAEEQLIVSKAQKNINSLLLGYNRITAVADGKVYKKFKQRGDFVRKGDAIASIGDAGFIYAKVSIDEGSIAKIQKGQQAIIQLNTSKDKNYRGKVAEILPAFNEETQSFTCKIYFTDSLDFTIINTQLQANIITGNTKNAMLIPRNFLGYGNLVKVKEQQEPVKVETRFVSSEWVQVVSGLDENTVIVTDNIK